MRLFLSQTLLTYPMTVGYNTFGLVDYKAIEAITVLPREGFRHNAKRGHQSLDRQTPGGQCVFSGATELVA